MMERPPLYLAPPTAALALEELQLAAQERCVLLAAIAALGDGARSGAEAARLAQRLEIEGDDRADSVSHFALRLAFCKYVGRALGMVAASTDALGQDARGGLAGARGRRGQAAGVEAEAGGDGP